MGTKSSVSVIVPSRNEIYLQKTIQDLLKNATGSIEIIAVLDGYWPKAEELVDDPRVNYLHFSEAKGMRNAINQAVNIAKGKYLLKCDAHCMFGKGYDEQLKKVHQDKWIQVPRRYALDPVNWKIEERTDNKYPVDYMYLSKDLHGVIWDDLNQDEELDSLKLCDLMSAQGSCWFMTKEYYIWLELLDEESYGKFWVEFQEIGLKCWLSGGSVKVNKNTWYAHWHKPETRGYSLADAGEEKAKATLEKWRTGIVWSKQRYSLSWLIYKFSPVPTWET